MDVPPAFPTETVVLNDPPAAQYDLIVDFLDTNMFKLYSDMMGSQTLLIHQRKTTKFGYLPMMTVSLKTDEIRMFVILRMNREFMELGLFVDKDDLINYQLLII